MSVLKMSDIDLKDKKILIRQDLNVPIKDGVITSDQRIQASIPTIRKALDAGASVILMSHLGRPTEGKTDQQYSLLPVAKHLMALLQQPVRLITDYLDNEIELKAGEVVLLENVRFNVGEKSNDEGLARQYASLCDVFVMDAFGTAHRAQASTYGAGVYAPVACAGPLLARELDALANAMESPKKPLVAIVGGSKVSTKLTVLESLMGVVDYLIVGGGIANTFIAASGHNVGKSLYEADLLETCKKLMDQARSRGADIPVPVDVVCAKEFSESAEATTKPVAEVAEDDMILDVGPQTCEQLKSILASAGTIIWNGPVGVFEIDQFAGGTESISNAIADAPGFTLAGGGDTLAAVDKYNIADKVSYISTGGGAFLEFLEGKKLPAVEMLETKAQSTH